MNKILTISVAAYNAEKDIKKCLDSMVNNSVSEKLEIIVVNDGSKDKTLQIAKEYEDKYRSVVRIIDKENGGHGSTINASIKESTGKYFKIVDSDDWVDKNGIENLVHKLENIEADLVLNPYQVIDAKTLQKKDLIKPYTLDATIGEICPIENIKDIEIYMHSVTFKTSVIKKTGPIIDENCFYVDMEYTLFPLQYVNSFICFDFPVYQYVLGSEGQSMNKNNLINRREQHLFVTKRVIEHYEKNKKNMKQGIKEIVLRRVRFALLNQYKIYFNMINKTARKEILAFDQWAKNKSSDVYKGPEGRLMKIVRFNRKTRFTFFNSIVIIMRVLHLEPEL